MTTAIQRPSIPAIEYPDSDGLPMSDHTLQYKWIVVIKEGTQALFADVLNVFVAANLLWYPVEGKPRIRGAPDVMVAFGRPRGERGSYKQWEEGGTAPHVVFEVLSPGNRPPEMRRKLAFYQTHGVEEYYIYDPIGGSLEGWRRVKGALRKIGRMRGFVSPRLGIRFEPGKGSDNLTIVGPDGQRFKTFSEILEENKAAKRRADEAERELAAESRRAETAVQRAERYAAMLRELGIEPD